MAAKLFTVTTRLSGMTENRTVYVDTDQQRVLDRAWDGQGQHWADSHYGAGDEQFAQKVDQEVRYAWLRMRNSPFSEQPEKFLPCHNIEDETKGSMVVITQVMTMHQVNLVKASGGITVVQSADALNVSKRNEDMATLLLAPRRTS